MSILVPDVFNDPMEYLQAEAVLRRLFDRIKCEEYQGPMWTRWHTYTFNSGTRLYGDGSPVYTQFCEERRKGIVIWLKDADKMTGYGIQPETYFESCLKVADPDFARIDELEVNCVLSDENLEQVENLIRLYMVDDVTSEALEAVIEERGLGFRNPPD
ncbi:hypothetical protein [Pelagibius marinus]|uniref:hypothetical protein n=1 Tax=Pelagibius marinus TaxID=2762760 RepID=UPI001872E05F|nr:hypothetical protein [Pelagibius marinus]